MAQHTFAQETERASSFGRTWLAAEQDEDVELEEEFREGSLTSALDFSTLNAPSGGDEEDQELEEMTRPDQRLGSEEGEGEGGDDEAPPADGASGASGPGGGASSGPGGGAFGASDPGWW